MKMALGPAEARALFERQALLSVRDALAVVQDAQRVMAREPNVVRVRGACMFGAFPLLSTRLSRLRRLTGPADGQWWATSMASSSTSCACWTTSARPMAPRSRVR